MPMQASTIDFWTHSAAAIVSDIADALRREKIIGLSAERYTHRVRYPNQKVPNKACSRRCKDPVPNGRSR